jgi:hypothetical protein
MMGCTHTHSIPIACLFVQNQEREKKKKYTNRIYSTYDRRWMTNDCEIQTRKKTDLYKKKKKNTVEVVTQRQKPTGKFHH